MLAAEEEESSLVISVREEEERVDRAQRGLLLVSDLALVLDVNRRQHSLNEKMEILISINTFKWG